MTALAVSRAAAVAQVAPCFARNLWRLESLPRDLQALPPHKDKLSQQELLRMEEELEALLAYPNPAKPLQWAKVLLDLFPTTGAFRSPRHMQTYLTGMAEILSEVPEALFSDVRKGIMRRQSYGRPPEPAVVCEVVSEVVGTYLLRRDQIRALRLHKARQQQEREQASRCKGPPPEVAAAARAAGMTLVQYLIAKTADNARPAPAE